MILPLNMYPMEPAYPLTQLQASDGQSIWVTADFDVCETSQDESRAGSLNCETWYM